ncbi:MAG: hypothetical protein L6R00_19170 [Phycisphaerae bacterium]|nr:hypothetical protein [Phycisphaerae bacterium]
MARKNTEELVRSETTSRGYLRFPVVSEGAEYLVMGNLMRRNILTYKAPPLNEGYDLICIHPDPRHRPRRGEKSQLRIQVKSRYQTDSDLGFPVKRETFNAFDFLIVVFLNIGEFFGGRDGSFGAAPPEFYSLPSRVVRRWHEASTSWQKVRLKGRGRILEQYKGERGFELVAEALGVPKPTR